VCHPTLIITHSDSPANPTTMAAQDLDAQTLRAIIRLQLDELELLSQNSKGKSREGEAVVGFDLALELYKAEVASCALVLADSSMCRSIARAVSLDRCAIDEAAREELQARRDRELALRLSGQSGHSQPADVLDPKPDQDSVGPDPDAELIRRLAALYMTPDDDGSGTPNQPESSSWAQSREPPIPTTECISCGDAHPTTDVAHCPCSHCYCRVCLASLFRASMLDEALFPPRCCREPIPLDANRKFLAADLTGQFQAKKIEFETKDRTYCHRPECSTFVPPQFIHGDVATCVRCQRRTCAICKGVSHVGECPRDEAAQEVLRLAQENGWQRCYACRRVVELDHGCNHMSMSPLHCRTRTEDAMAC
jgi:hypothetical protein